MSKPFVIKKLLDAPVDLAWELCTSPVHLSHWFGPKGSSLVRSSMDLSVGGSFHYCLDMGGGQVWGLWKFVEIDPPRRLTLIQSFSDPAGGAARHPMAPIWPLYTLSTTTLVPEGGKTNLTLQWTPHEASAEEVAVFDASHASMNQGWGGSFEVLEQYLASLAQ